MEASIFRGYVVCGYFHRRFSRTF